jgi:hypothetical protein
MSPFSGERIRGRRDIQITRANQPSKKRFAALMVYDREDVEEAQLSGPGPCIHHWGIEVEDRDSYVAKIEANGGTIISEPGEGALKFRAPDGTVAEIVEAGRYNKKKAEKAPA